MKYTKSKNDVVNVYINELDEKLAQLFVDIRETVLATSPNFEEDIKWKNCLTYAAKRNAIQTVVGKDKITLIFFEGASFDDKYNLLEGDGKKTRSYRISGKINKTALKNYVKQAYTRAS